MDDKKSFSSTLKDASQREPSANIEFVVMDDLVVATCPACSAREEISLNDLDDSFTDLTILCSECETPFSIPDLNDLLNLKMK